MELKNEFNSIREWANTKGIYSSGDIKTQCLKLQEEVGELSRAIIRNDRDEIIDAIGDCVIVLTSIAEFVKHVPVSNNKFTGVELNESISIEKCINLAYNVIKNRQGKMENGSFKKEE
jgi:hypothetical protein